MSKWGKYHPEISITKTIWLASVNLLLHEFTSNLTSIRLYVSHSATQSRLQNNHKTSTTDAVLRQLSCVNCELRMLPKVAMVGITKEKLYDRVPTVSCIESLFGSLGELTRQISAAYPLSSCVTPFGTRVVQTKPPVYRPDGAKRNRCKQRDREKLLAISAK